MMTMIILMKGDMCVCGEGIGADKGVLAQKTELPGIYPSLLLLLMMMMMTMMVMMMTLDMIIIIIIIESEEAGSHMNRLRANLNSTSFDF